MKILFLTRLFYPHIGGVEKHVYEISKILSNNGHNITIVTEQYSKNLEFKEKIGNIIIYRIPNLSKGRFKKFEIWYWLLVNRNLINSADIVHCHDVFFWYLPFRFMYFKKPVFITFHGYETKYPLSKKAIIMRKISSKLSIGNISVGNFIEKWYGTKSDHVIYGAVSQEDNGKLFSNKIKNIIKTKDRRLRILFLGRVEIDNGLQIFLESLKILKKERIKFSFLICGDGVFRKKAENYGKVLGFITNPAKYIAFSDVVFSSSYLSILEGISFKKLVISTYTNPLKEDYLKMSPFKKYIFIENDPRGITKRIKSYIKNPSENKKMIDEAYNFTKTQSWEKIVKTYLKLWN